MRLKALLLTVIFVLGFSLKFQAVAGVSPASLEKNADTLIGDTSPESVEIQHLFIVPVEVSVAAPSSSGRIAGRSYSGNSGNSHSQQNSALTCAGGFGSKACCCRFFRKVPLPERAIDYYLYFLYRLRL